MDENMSRGCRQRRAHRKRHSTRFFWLQNAKRRKDMHAGKVTANRCSRQVIWAVMNGNKNRRWQYGR